MAEQAQSQRPTEQKQEAQAAAEAQHDEDTDIFDLDELDREVGDIIEKNKNLAANYKQKGGQ